LEYTLELLKYNPKLRMMKKNYLHLLTVTLMSFAFPGCFAPDENPDVPWVPPVEVIKTGNGLLRVGVGADAVTTKSTYSWILEDSKIQIDIKVDMEQYLNGDVNVAGGGWEIGNFVLPTPTVNEYLDTFVSELDETTFFAIEPNGTVVPEMTSYKPGMWVKSDGYAAGWSASVMYWQWYIWEGVTDKDGDVISYDYPSATYGDLTGLVVIGGNPMNVVNHAGEKVTSKARIVVGNTVFDWIVNIEF
jgi:hypothetical protein